MSVGSPRTVAGRSAYLLVLQPKQQGSLIGEVEITVDSATGAPLAFGSDAPVEIPDPFDGMAAAITREDAHGQPPGGWQPDETISREAALAAYTAGAAYAGFADGKFGELKPGLRADFLVLDRDPFLVSPAELRGIRVLQTWIGGVKVYDAAPKSDTPRDPEEGR